MSAYLLGRGGSVESPMCLPLTPTRWRNTPQGCLVPNVAGRSVADRHDEPIGAPGSLAFYGQLSRSPF